MRDRPLEKPVLLLPSQVELFEKAGWVRGRDFVVYQCLFCFEAMDRCKCRQSTT